MEDNRLTLSPSLQSRLPFGTHVKLNKSGQHGVIINRTQREPIQYQIKISEGNQYSIVTPDMIREDPLHPGDRVIIEDGMFRGKRGVVKHYPEPPAKSDVEAFALGLKLKLAEPSEVPHKNFIRDQHVAVELSDKDETLHLVQ